MQAIEQRNTSSALANLSSSDSLVAARLDSVLGRPVDGVLLSQATARARSLRSEISSAINTLDVYNTERRVFEIQWHKILASSLACIAMFLIGAPLGAIIKKGGLGVPFLVSILFFIIYYLLTMAGEKWAKQGIIAVPAGVWAADVILFIIGLIFLRQARLDARLFDADAYLVAFDKFRIWLVKRGILPQTT
jgi:lipopolysaccharide export system permease protein